MEIPMTVVALTLLVVAVAASFGNPDRAPLLTGSVTGMVAAMIGVMVVPGFSSLAGASSIVLLALVVVTATVVGKAVRRRPLERWRTVATAITVVDLVFMAMTMLVVPDHGVVQPPAAATLPATQGAIGSHPAIGGGLMVWLILFAWAACAVALTLPRRHGHTAGGVFHLVCSGSMIAAMATMTL